MTALYQLVGGLLVLFVSSLVVVFAYKLRPNSRIGWDSIVIFYLLAFLGCELFYVYEQSLIKPVHTVNAIGSGSDVCGWDCMSKQAPTDCVGQCSWCMKYNWMCTGCFYCDSERYYEIKPSVDYWDNANETEDENGL